MDGGGGVGGGRQLGPVRKVRAQHLLGLLPLGAPSASWTWLGRAGLKCGLWLLSRVPDWICDLGQHLGSQAALEGLSLVP